MHSILASIGWHLGTWLFRLGGLLVVGTVAFLACRGVGRRIARMLGGRR